MNSICSRLLLFALFVSCFLEIHGKGPKDIGYFWQVTDFHYDANYSISGDPDKMCHMTGNGSNGTIGYYGNYLCDAPWKLVMSAIEAMYEHQPNPDFILWTGDSVPHVDDKQLNADKVYTLIGNITDELRAVFDNVTIFPVLGNHDPYPSNMMPFGQQGSAYYKNILKRSGWEMFPDVNNSATFKHGGYYSAMISKKIKLLGLNTDLYYDQDRLTKDVSDPAGQLQWLDDELTKSEKQKEVVYLMAHVPPGVFELVENLTWFYPEFNRKYLNILEKHSGVIKAQFYGHEHTDSFRVMYDKYGKPSNSLFLSPAVTPWKSTLKGVGANNPSIRLYHYNREDGVLEKYVQYFLNLTAANTAGNPQAKWTVEYDTSRDYGLDELNPGKLHDLVEAFSARGNRQFRYYLNYNSVGWDTKSECNGTCFRRHYCAITQLDISNYRTCMSGGQTTVDPFTITPPPSVTVPDYLYYTIAGLGGVVFLLFLSVAYLCFNKHQIASRGYNRFRTKSLNGHPKPERA